MRIAEWDKVPVTVRLPNDLYQRLLRERMRQMSTRHTNVSRQVVLVELIEEGLNRRDGKPE